MTQRRFAVVLVNLGTPDEPTPGAVRRYLKEFLSDPRVVEVPRAVWFWVLRLFILPFRPRRVAALYRSIWEQDSPIRRISSEQARALEERLGVPVRYGMTYGRPALPAVLDELVADGVEQLLILPLFPQYSGSTTGAVFDALAGWIRGRREVPAISVVRDYWRNPAYIDALAQSIRDFQAENGEPEKLLFSFHGIPQSYERKGDRYGERCRGTAEAVAKRLGLQADRWAMTFQSRFGPQEWLQPYTDKTLEQWAKDGVRRVQVICPGFAADCLETLEEIAVQNREIFTANGGETLQYIPALNASQAHISLLESVVRAECPAKNSQNSRETSA